MTEKRDDDEKDFDAVVDGMAIIRHRDDPEHNFERINRESAIWTLNRKKREKKEIPDWLLDTVVAFGYSYRRVLGDEELD